MAKIEHIPKERDPYPGKASPSTVSFFHPQLKREEEQYLPPTRPTLRHLGLIDGLDPLGRDWGVPDTLYELSGPTPCYLRASTRQQACQDAGEILGTSLPIDSGAMTYGYLNALLYLLTPDYTDYDEETETYFPDYFEQGYSPYSFLVTGVKTVHQMFQALLQKLQHVSLPTGSEEDMGYLTALIHLGMHHPGQQTFLNNEVNDQIIQKAQELLKSQSIEIFIENDFLVLQAEYNI